MTSAFQWLFVILLAACVIAVALDRKPRNRRTTLPPPVRDTRDWLGADRESVSRHFPRQS